MEAESTTELSLKQKIGSKFAFLKNIHSFFYYVLLLIAVGFGFFGYALITQKFTTPYSGDFSQQAYQLYYDFYDDWWTFFKTGQFPFYDSNTLIGADNLIANTYYGLFSPFTFPILFVSRDFIPHMMALISIARLVIGGLLFRVYLKYLGASEKSARLFSIAYAFTGWMAYYLWFNPFYEVLTFFPLILFGIEKVIKERKIWAVCLGFFLLGISNYFFLLTSGIFGVAYAGFRFFQTLKTRNAKENLLVILYGFLGFLFGFGLSMFAVYPALIGSFSINRAVQSTYLPNLKEALLSGDYTKFFKLFFTCWSSSVVNWGDAYSEYYYSFVFPLASYFFPTVSDRFTNIVHCSYFENSGSSIFIYTPCMILMGVSIYRSIINKKVSHFIAMTCIIACLFIPFFYFLCGAFVTAYGRWEIVVPMAALAYIALNFDHINEVPRPVVIVSGLVTMACMIGTYFLAIYIDNLYNCIVPMNQMVYLVIYEIATCVIETGLLAGFWKKKYLSMIIDGLLAGEIVVVGTLVANIHSLQSISTSVAGGYNNVPAETEIMKEINDNDNSYFRVQTSRMYEGNSNLGMVENFNGVGAFHTFYNNDVDDFLRFSQIMNNDSSWSGVYFSKRSNLDEFLGIKYYITKDSDTMFNYYDSNGDVDHVVWDPNVPLGYERIDDASVDDGYRVYKNKYQINLGTSYDTVYFKNDCSSSYYNSFYPYPSATEFVIRNEEAYFTGAILNNEDAYKVMQQCGSDLSYEQAPFVSDNAAKAISINVKGIYANTNGKYFDPKNPDRDINDASKLDTAKGVSTNIIQIAIEPSSSTYFPIGAEGGYYMFDYPIRQSSGKNYSATVYLIGEDELGNSKVITFDNGGRSSRGSGRSIRGLYSKEKIKRIIVCADGDSYVSTVSSMHLSYEPFEECVARYQNAIDNGLNDVTYNVNTFTFNTNYATSRFVVTQLAYTGGWHVYATDKSGVTKELSVYNSEGGFAGFVAPSGENTYKITYLTPHFKTGLAITVASLLGFSGVSVIGLVVAKRKKKES